MSAKGKSPGLDGPFEPGVSGRAKQRGNLGRALTITAVDDGRRWVTECPMPMGKVVFEHVIEPVAAGRVRVIKRARCRAASGPCSGCSPLRMRRENIESLSALERLMSA